MMKVVSERVMERRECAGCGCYFEPRNDGGVSDVRCPYCGGGRGIVTQTPIERIRNLENRIGNLEDS